MGVGCSPDWGHTLGNPLRMVLQSAQTHKPRGRDVDSPYEPGGKGSSKKKIKCDVPSRKEKKKKAASGRKKGSPYGGVAGQGFAVVHSRGTGQRGIIPAERKRKQEKSSPKARRAKTEFRGEKHRGGCCQRQKRVNDNAV